MTLPKRSGSNGNAPAARRDVVVIGGSAGAIEGLKTIVASLPQDTPAIIMVVVHLSPNSVSNLPEILRRVTAMPVRHPFNGELAVPGRVYIAPPDKHLILRDGGVALTRGPRENRVRPAVDVLFRSAASNPETRVIGVVLSGGLADGAAGLAAIRRAGGVAIVQDPEEASSPSMPASAIERGPVDYVLPVEKIGPTIMQLLSAEIPRHPHTESNGEDLSEEGYGITCPECWGILHEESEHGVPSFACRVGHRFSEQSLLDAQADGVEAALWMAVRALEERADLTQRMARRLQFDGRNYSAERLARQAHDAAFRAEMVRRLLEPDYVGGDAKEPEGKE
jgi:two-component system chemotaxis response regulator CheB